MNILVVGLGLIGGSYALGLKKAGHTIYAYDSNHQSLDYALTEGFIDFKVTDLKDAFKSIELVILGLYPELIIPFIKENNKYFNENILITDVCGVKQYYINEATKLSHPARYLGHHPMAGREKSGVYHVDDEIFYGANFIITPLEKTLQSDIDILRGIAHDLSFGNIIEISPETHDDMIAHTSQLTHALAIALVNSPQDANIFDFIGNSYRDLTRIAMINEELWKELFFTNKDALINQIDLFETELNKIKGSLQNNKPDELVKLFSKAKKVRSNL